MKTAFLCINYNNAWISTNFVNNVLSLRNADKYVDCVVVVDNGSKDEDYARLQDGLKGVDKAVLIRSDDNVGYSRGINLGLHYIYDHFDVDYIVGGNNDLLFEYDFLDVLEQARYKPEHYLIAPDVVTLDGFHQNPARETESQSPFKDKVIGFLLTHPPVGSAIISLRTRFKRPAPKVQESKCIYIPVGACFVFTKQYRDHCGTIPELVFMWAEEDIMAEHVRRCGGQVYYDASLIVHHFESASVSALPSKEAQQMLKESFIIKEKYVHERD